METAAEELQHLLGCIDSCFEQRDILSKKYENICSTPLWQLIGRPPFRAFEHLVHYGANYFCYLFCR